MNELVDSEELKFASKNGYKIEVLRGYNFNKNKDVFKSYVEEVYKPYGENL